MFSPGGRFLAACNHESVQVFSHPGGTRSKSFKVLGGRGDYVLRLMFGSHETQIVFVNPWCVQTWSINENRELVTFRLPENERAVDARETPDGKLVLCSSASVENGRGYVYVTDVVRNTHLTEIPLDHPCLWSKVSADGTLLLIAFGGERKCYEVWNLTENRRLCELPEEHIVFPEPNVLLEDGQCIVAGRGVKIWDLAAASLLAQIDFPPEYPVKCSYSKTTGLLAATWNSIEWGKDRTLFLNPMTGKVVGETHGHTWENPVFSPCGRWFASVVDHNFLVERRNHPVSCGSVFLTDLAPILPTVQAK
jgi:WD40 repeat protein